jgi:hypothetical protein
MKPMKSIKLTSPEELDAGHEWLTLSAQQDKDTAMLAAKFKREMEELNAHYAKRYRDAFVRMVEKHIPDPIAAWTNGTHSVQLNYIEHGAIFLCEMPKADQEPDQEPDEPDYQVQSRKIVLN